MALNELASIFRQVLDDLFKENGFECKKIYYIDEIYYSSKDIIKCLQLNKNNCDTNLILRTIHKSDKFTMEQLKNKYHLSLTIPNENKDELYINKSGLYQLIGSSDAKETKPFKSFIFRTLLPELDKQYDKLLQTRKAEYDALHLKLDELLNINQTLLNKNKLLIDNMERVLEKNDEIKNLNNNISYDIETIRKRILRNIH